MLGVLRPTLWRWLRRPMELEFGLLAFPRWETMRAEHSLAPLVAALETVQAPRRALDLGAGTVPAHSRSPSASRTPRSSASTSPARWSPRCGGSFGTPSANRVEFEQAEASCLPFEDGACDLVVLLNMIPPRWARTTGCHPFVPALHPHRAFRMSDAGAATSAGGRRARQRCRRRARFPEGSAVASSVAVRVVRPRVCGRLSRSAFAAICSPIHLSAQAGST
jgi:hypothetical protein